MTGLAVLVSGTVVVACSFLTEPGEVRPPRAEGPPQFLLSQQDPGGCRKVRFTLTGSMGVEGVYPDTACGMQVELVAAGPMSRSGDTVSIPFRLRNRSASAVPLPLRVEVRDSGIVDLDPLEVPTAEMVPLNMDSTLSGGRSVWLVGGTGSLAAGDSTGADTLLFQVTDSVTAVAVSFEVVGNEGFVVTLVPPDFKPAWFGHDSSYFEVGGVQKRVLGVDFEPGATVGERAAALAVIGGEVVGGMRLPSPYEGGFYFVRVPGNPSVTQLDSLAGVLRAQPKVAYANPTLQGGTVQGIRPVDGTGWERSAWGFNPDLSAGGNWAYEEIAAPLAWGCSVGDGVTRIAVLDMLFDRTEVDSNVVSPLPPYGQFPG